jgi:hypothetical protein
MGMSGQLEKSHWYPLDRRLGESQSRSGHGGEDKIFQPLPGLEPPIIQPVVQSYTTELSRLLGWLNHKAWDRVGKVPEMRPLRRPRRLWEDVIKMDLR